MHDSYHFQAGNSPLLISMPHVGTLIPDGIKVKMSNPGLQVPDTDWHLPRLYDMTAALGISVLSARHSRYVIDLNRAPDDSSLYPGLSTTSLCPVDTFASDPIYLDGMAPEQEEIEHRVIQYWQPYHQKLLQELERLRNLHGIAILWDAHSIASQVPRFFTGRLPDLNFGTADGKSCDPSLQNALLTTLHNSGCGADYSYVFNGRFKGGFITRHYGKPENATHAIQLEMSQIIYMNEHAPYSYVPRLANRVQLLLHALLTTCQSWAQARHAN